MTMSDAQHCRPAQRDRLRALAERLSPHPRVEAVDVTTRARGTVLELVCGPQGRGLPPQCSRQIGAAGAWVSSVTPQGDHHIAEVRL